MSVLRLGTLMALVVAIASPVLAQPAPAPQAPPAAQPIPAPPAPKPLQPNDAFGEEVTMVAKPMVLAKGAATWDTAFDTLIDSLKAVETSSISRGSSHRAIP